MLEQVGRARGRAAVQERVLVRLLRVVLLVFPSYASELQPHPQSLAGKLWFLLEAVLVTGPVVVGPLESEHLHVEDEVPVDQPPQVGPGSVRAMPLVAGHTAADHAGASERTTVGATSMRAGVVELHTRSTELGWHPLVALHQGPSQELQPLPGHNVQHKWLHPIRRILQVLTNESYWTSHTLSPEKCDSQQFR